MQVMQRDCITPSGWASRFGWETPRGRAPQPFARAVNRPRTRTPPPRGRACVFRHGTRPPPGPSPGREGSMHTARIVALLAAFSCAASAARAQYPQRRDGFWIGFGLGYGSANIKCDQCVDSSGVGGVTGFVKLGGTPSRNVLIGGAINVWAHSDGTGNTETVSNVTASVYLYPQAKSGFFLTGGLGFSNYYVNTVPSSDGTGWGFTGGAGYDIRVGRDVSLTPVVNFVYGALADFDVPVSGGGSVRARNWRQNVVDLGLGVTFH